MKIYTLGYSGWKLEQIEAEAQRLDAVIVDVRLKASSRIPTFRGSVLQKRFGESYRWIPAFGNRNYRGGPIEIVDFHAGLAEVRKIAAAGRNVILMCMCRDAEMCHRKIVAEWLAEALQAEVEHLSIPG